MFKYLEYRLFIATMVLFVGMLTEDKMTNIMQCAACSQIALMEDSWQCKVNCDFVGTEKGW